MRSFKTGLQVTAAVLIARVIFAQEIIQPGQSTRGAGPERAVSLNNGFIVTFAPGTSKTARALAASQAGAQVRYNYDNLAAISITASSNALNALRSNPAVIRVTQDSIHRGRAKPGSGGGGTPLTFDTRQIISEG